MARFRTLWGLIEQRAEHSPQCIFLRDEDGRTLTFRQFHDQAQRVAAGLHEQGISASSTVAWQLPTWQEALILTAALARLGARQVPMLPMLRDASVSFICRQVKADLLVVPKLWKQFDHAAMAHSVRAELPDMQVLAIDKGELPEGEATLPPAPADTAPEEPVRWVFYTSGTTGDPNRGRVLRLDDGAVMRWTGDDPRGTFIILEGCLSSRTDRGGAVRVVRDLGPGTISGVLPYSRIKAPSVYTVAVGSVELLLIDESDLTDMIRECHDFTARCVHEMVDRARVFRSDDLHQEKMAALGRLSAGLAHELANPSSAIARSAGRLEAAQRELAEAARALGSAAISDDAASTLRTLESALDESAYGSMSALELADREDEIGDWLDARGVDGGHAYALAASGLSEPELETAAASLAQDELAVVLRFLTARIEAGQLADEIEGAAGRVHTLVDAVKKHTHMDRAPVVEAIALEEHLAGVLTLVGSKARARSIDLELTVEPDLPPVGGLVSDLNHVWMNLVDNAIDAVGESGRVSVTARTDAGFVVVDVADSGSGIPEEDLARVFDPFFTTKGVGQGAGLGLHVVRNIVESHKGSVDVTSEPGQTRFSVRLPLDGQREGAV